MFMAQIWMILVFFVNFINFSSYLSSLVISVKNKF